MSIQKILEENLSVTDEWGGNKLAQWQYGNDVLVAGIPEAAQKIEALMPTPISVKVCGLPKEMGWYGVWIKNLADPNVPYIFNNLWFNGKLFVCSPYNPEEFTAKVEFYLFDEELLKLLPKGE